MQFKHLVVLAPAVIVSATLTTAHIAKAESPDASPSPSLSAQTKHKFSPQELKARRLAALKNQVGLTAEQEAKAKLIIDRYVDDQTAAKGYSLLSASTGVGAAAFAASGRRNVADNPNASTVKIPPATNGVFPY